MIRRHPSVATVAIDFFAQVVEARRLESLAQAEALQGQRWTEMFGRLPAEMPGQMIGTNQVHRRYLNRLNARQDSDPSLAGRSSTM